MSKVNSSPERHTFQAERYVERCKENGEEPNEDYLNMYKSAREQDQENLANPEWQKLNLEYDLRSTEWICSKVKASESYAQNLYAAMCNNEFQRNDVWPVLKDQRWSCSWRYAGGIVADMLEQGDYIDWYCSGIKNNLTQEEERNLTEEQKQRYEISKHFVSESVVTDEIRSDLFALGWIVVDDDQNVDT